MSESKNRNPVKLWEWTIPCSEEKGYTKESVSKMLPVCEEWFICEEIAPTSGKKHLHVGMKLVGPLSRSHMKKLVDRLFGENAVLVHYSPIRSIKHFKEYCEKEDKNVLSGKKPWSWNDYWKKYPDQKKICDALEIKIDPITGKPDTKRNFEWNFKTYPPDPSYKPWLPPKLEREETVEWSDDD